MVGVGLSIDGYVVPFTFSYTFTIGQHTFVLDILTGATMADANDFFNVTLLY